MNLDHLKEDLKSGMQGDVQFNSTYRALYATDASNYREIPLGVVYPTSREDIVHIVAVCRAHGVPLLSRGGGTGLAGQTTNVAVVMDHSAHYNRLLKIDPEKKIAIVQPGIVLDDLRQAAEKFGLTFGPDPATHSRCTLGGMMGNNSCGVHSVMAGRTVDNVHALDVLTYEGLQLHVGATTDEQFQRIIAAGGRPAEIYGRLRKLAEKYQRLIHERFPQIPRRVSGFNLEALLPENGFHVARALIGSEGTCATILEAELQLVKSPAHRALVVVGFDSVENAGANVVEIMSYHPIGLEGLDDRLVSHMKDKHLLVKDVELLPDGNSWLLIEIGEDSEEEKERHALNVAREVRRLKGFMDVKVVLEKEQQKKFWDVREAGLGATAFVPGQADTWEGWEDSAVPPEKVAPYLHQLRKLLQKYDYDGALYGHFGQGCIHTRINFDFRSAHGQKKYRDFTLEAADLVVSLGGSLSGEHGDGQSRAELLPRMFGPELVDAFGEFKKIWDPLEKMNPGKVVFPHSRTQNLRMGTDYEPWEPKTHFQYPQDRGSFARATTRCVGVGACRKKSGGVMCPSYMVTQDEKHCTRGRAHLLFEMLQGEVITSGWNSEEVKESLDLCLACKGCKGECPVNVDMATYKAEFLSHYYEKHWRPREAYSMGRIRTLAALASVVPSLTNWMTRTPGLSRLIKKVAGIHPRRDFPSFAGKTYRKLAGRDAVTASRGKPSVYLWVDTFCNYFHPEIAASARKVLESAGYEVKLPRKQYCCGRPLYDYGLLDQARELLVEFIRDFKDEIRDGQCIVFLEPSCASVFRDEMKSFFPNDPDVERLRSQCLTLSEFLVKRVPQYEWPQTARKALIQGHCHHRSVLDFPSEEKALKNIFREYEILDSGCCGMAGSFGFSEEHYDISQACGERVLFKKINEADPGSLIIADGFSCREQIKQGTGRRAYHLAEVLAGDIDKE